MPLVYRLSAARRLVNGVVRPLARLGLAGRGQYVLTVPGRRSGEPRSLPVTVIAVGGERFLVAPYGERQWVKNARAAGEVELTRARRTERARVEELAPAEAAPVLRRYLRAAPVTRPYFGVGPGGSDEELAAEAPRHPVFRLRPVE